MKYLQLSPIINPTILSDPQLIITPNIKPITLANRSNDSTEIIKSYSLLTASVSASAVNTSLKTQEYCLLPQYR